MSIGSWLRDRPYLLEPAYEVTHWLSFKLKPLLERVGYERIGKLIVPLEEAGKKTVFDCRMCGQCILHSTGMTCPMTCPKNLRNGPCGGVRLNGHCEVKPEMKCVWVEAYERSEQMHLYGPEIQFVQPPVNWQLQGESAWITLLNGEALVRPAGWPEAPPHLSKARFKVPQSQIANVRYAGATALGTVLISLAVWVISHLLDGGRR